MLNFEKVNNSTQEEKEDFVDKILRLVSIREAHKDDGNFKKADELRDYLSELNITIKDYKADGKFFTEVIFPRVIFRTSIFTGPTPDSFYKENIEFGNKITIKYAIIGISDTKKLMREGLPFEEGREGIEKMKKIMRDCGFKDEEYLNKL